MGHEANVRSYRREQRAKTMLGRLYFLESRQRALENVVQMLLSKQVVRLAIGATDFSVLVDREHEKIYGEDGGANGDE